MSFLDEYCIIFDSEDENKLEYTPIHLQFKRLVEELIGELLAELGVDQDTFMQACAKAEKNPLHKKIVDQIVAVDNFVAFKKLMCKRNAELNQQAMKLMESKEEEKKEKKAKTEDAEKEQTKAIKGGKVPKDKEMQEALKVAQEAERLEEEEFMRKAIEESQKFEEESKKEEDEEMKMIQEAIKMSIKEEFERKMVENKEIGEQIKTSEEKFAEPVIVKQPQSQAPPVEVANPVEAPMVETAQPPKDLIEFKAASGMSEAEMKKFEDLRNMKRQGTLKKSEPKADMDLPKIKADALPPVMMSRKGQFEMIPDFLQNKKVAKDLTSLGEMDMMQEALKKQEEANANSGLSMKELFEKKRIDAEKKLEEAKIAGPSKNEVEERKARLLAQRDLLRQQKEAKRQEELETFKSKTETKEDLF